MNRTLTPALTTLCYRVLAQASDAACRSAPLVALAFSITVLSGIPEAIASTAAPLGVRKVRLHGEGDKPGTIRLRATAPVSEVDLSGGAEVSLTDGDAFSHTVLFDPARCRESRSGRILCRGAWSAYSKPRLILKPLRDFEPGAPGYDVRFRTGGVRDTGPLRAPLSIVVRFPAAETSGIGVLEWRGSGPDECRNSAGFIVHCRCRGGASECDGICESGRRRGYGDCDHLCAPNGSEDGTSDCDGICDAGGLETASDDCDGICTEGEEGGPDCDGVCTEGEGDGPDCDGTCVEGEAGGPDCDGVCAADASEDSGPDCVDLEFSPPLVPLITSRDLGSAKIYWTPARAAGGIDRYEVHCGDSEDFTPGPGTLCKETDSLGRRADIDGLNPGQRYWLTVVAFQAGTALGQSEVRSLVIAEEPTLLRDGVTLVRACAGTFTDSCSPEELPLGVPEVREHSVHYPPTTGPTPEPGDYFTFFSSTTGQCSNGPDEGNLCDPFAENGDCSPAIAAGFCSEDPGTACTQDDDCGAGGGTCTLLPACSEEDDGPSAPCALAIPAHCSPNHIRRVTSVSSTASGLDIETESANLGSVYDSMEVSASLDLLIDPAVALPPESRAGGSNYEPIRHWQRRTAGGALEQGLQWPEGGLTVLHRDFVPRIKPESRRARGEQIVGRYCFDLTDHILPLTQPRVPGICEELVFEFCPELQLPSPDANFKLKDFSGHFKMIGDMVAASELTLQGHFEDGFETPKLQLHEKILYTDGIISLWLRINLQFVLETEVDFYLNDRWEARKPIELVIKKEPGFDIPDIDFDSDSWRVTHTFDILFDGEIVGTAYLNFDVSGEFAWFFAEVGIAPGLESVSTLRKHLGDADSAAPVCSSTRSSSVGGVVDLTASGGIKKITKDIPLLGERTIGPYKVGPVRYRLLPELQFTDFGIDYPDLWALPRAGDPTVTYGLDAYRNRMELEAGCVQDALTGPDCKDDGFRWYLEEPAAGVHLSSVTERNTFLECGDYVGTVDVWMSALSDFDVGGGLLATALLGVPDCKETLLECKACVLDCDTRRTADCASRSCICREGLVAATGRGCVCPDDREWNAFHGRCTCPTGFSEDGSGGCDQDQIEPLPNPVKPLEQEVNGCRADRSTCPVERIELDLEGCDTNPDTHEWRVWAQVTTHQETQSTTALDLPHFDFSTQSKRSVYSLTLPPVKECREVCNEIACTEFCENDRPLQLGDLKSVLVMRTPDASGGPVHDDDTWDLCVRAGKLIINGWETGGERMEGDEILIRAKKPFEIEVEPDWPVPHPAGNGTAGGGSIALFEQGELQRRLEGHLGSAFYLGDGGGEQIIRPEWCDLDTTNCGFGLNLKSYSPGESSISWAANLRQRQNNGNEYWYFESPFTTRLVCEEDAQTGDGYIELQLEQSEDPQHNSPVIRQAIERAVQTLNGSVRNQFLGFAVPGGCPTIDVGFGGAVDLRDFPCGLVCPAGEVPDCRTETCVCPDIQIREDGIGICTCPGDTSWNTDTETCQCANEREICGASTCCVQNEICWDPGGTCVPARNCGPKQMSCIGPTGTECCDSSGQNRQECRQETGECYTPLD